MIDVIKCYSGFNYSTQIILPEGLTLILFLSKMHASYKPVSYVDIEEFFNHNRNFYESIFQFINTFNKKIEITSDCPGFFNVSLLFSANHEMRQKFEELMFRFVDLTAHADFELSPSENKWVKQIEQVMNDSKAIPVSNDNSTTSLFKSDLDNLVGISTVKTEINKLTNFIKIQKLRKEKGMKSVPLSYHCVFTGNAGTGKTTVARIVAGIYKELGILKKGHLVETDRSGLVAEYVGQTAVKTNKIIDSAIDGVLFIDEAYSLVTDSSNDYGAEAIATLLKRMEDDRERLVVILAGYSEEMQGFIDSNPGLQSRFNRYIHFDDYSADELLKIFELNVQKQDYKLDENAKNKLKKLLDFEVAHRDRNFGNARYVRNLFEKTLENQATRLSNNTENLTEELLANISSDDIPIAS